MKEICSQRSLQLEFENEELDLALSYDNKGHLIWTEMKDTVVSSSIRRIGAWETDMVELWGILIRPGFSVISVGTHIGAHLVHLNDIVGPKGQIICFEMNNRTFEILRANYHLNNMKGNVILHNKAVYNENGDMQFVEKETSNTGSAYVAPIPPSFKGTSSSFLKVEAVELDDFLVGKVDHIDVLQMDAEGSEYMIALGATKLIEKSINLTVIMEWEQENIRRKDTEITEIINYWENLGFFFFLINNGLKPIARKELRISSGNLLLTRNPEMWNKFL